MHVDKIAFLTDLSGQETHAYRTAATLAGKLGALLQLVHVVEQGARYLRWAEDRLSEVAEEPMFRGAHVQTVILGGSDAYGALVEFTERENTRLIICAHSEAGTGGFSSELLLPERLVEVCSAPLLVLARGDQLASQRDDLGPRRVLIPYNLYEATGESLDIRGFLARRDHPVSFYLYRRAEAASLDPYADHVEVSEPIVGAENEVVHVVLGSGPAGEELVKSARALDVDLIVVSPSCEGHTGVSTEDFSWILRHAPSSVLAVKAPVGHVSTYPAAEGYEFYCG